MNISKNIIVLKCGGSTIDTLSDSFFTNIKKLQKAGFKPIIVHGGGPTIEKVLEKENIGTEFVNGLRKTTEKVLDVVETVLTGVINNNMVRKLNQAKIKAVGLSGSDAQLIQAEPIDLKKYGYVGNVSRVNVAFLHQLLQNDIVPVIAPIGIGENGTRFNINADTAAGAVAKAVRAKQLVFITDVPGIMKDNQLLPSVTEQEVKQLIQSGVITGGMIPKVQAALNSLGHELQEAMIVDGNQAVLSTADTKLVGTVIKKSVGVEAHVRSFSNV